MAARLSRNDEQTSFRNSGYGDLAVGRLCGPQPETIVVTRLIELPVTVEVTRLVEIAAQPVPVEVTRRVEVLVTRTVLTVPTETPATLEPAPEITAAPLCRSGYGQRRQPAPFEAGWHFYQFNELQVPVVASWLCRAGEPGPKSSWLLSTSRYASPLRRSQAAAARNRRAIAISPC